MATQFRETLVLVMSRRCGVVAGGTTRMILQHEDAITCPGITSTTWPNIIGCKLPSGAYKDPVPLAYCTLD